MSFKRKVLVSSESHTEFCWCCSVTQSCPTLCNPMVGSTLQHSEFGVSLLVSARKILSVITFRSLFYLSCSIFVASTPCFSSFCTCWLPLPLFIVIIRVFMGYNTVSSPYFYNTGLAKMFIQVFPMQDTPHTHTHEYLISIILVWAFLVFWPNPSVWLSPTTSRTLWGLLTLAFSSARPRTLWELSKYLLTK